MLSSVIEVDVTNKVDYLWLVFVRKLHNTHD
jgi:hypothetical protein